MLRVFHDNDGDFQFHSEENPDIENSRLITLESLVRQDPAKNVNLLLTHSQEF